MKKLDTKQKVMVGLLGLLILGLVGLILILPQLLKGEYSIMYPGGCIENYSAGELVEGNCSLERAMQNYYIKHNNKSMYFYLNRLEVNK